MDWQQLGYRKMYTCEHATVLLNKENGEKRNPVPWCMKDDAETSANACALCENAYVKANIEQLKARAIPEILLLEL